MRVTLPKLTEKYAASSAAAVGGGGGASEEATAGAAAEEVVVVEPAARSACHRSSSGSFSDASKATRVGMADSINVRGSASFAAAGGGADARESMSDCMSCGAYSTNRPCHVRNAVLP